MRNIFRFTFLFLLFISATSGYAWNASNDYNSTQMPENWRYVYQAASSWDGTYNFTNMIAYSGEVYIPSGWRGSNTQHYYMPMCGVWTNYGCLVTDSCKLGNTSTGTTPGQGFLCFVAPSSGTYIFSGNVNLYSGDSAAKTSAWVRSERNGLLWNQVLTEQYLAPVSFMIDLAEGQSVVFGQDILVGVGPYQSAPLYWNVNVSLATSKTLTGLQTWDAAKDFSGSSSSHNWSYVCEQSSSWSGSFNLGNLISSASHYGWWNAPNAPFINDEYVAGAVSENNRVILTGYNQSGGGKAISMLKWVAPENGYYRIHGSAQLDTGNSARLCVVIRDTATRVMDVWANTTSLNNYDQTLLLDKGDVVLFQIGEIVQGSGIYNRVMSIWEAKIEQVPTVPAPWTPVTSSGNSVSCWGRTYDFASNLLPNSIAATGTALLSSEIRFDATVGSASENFSNITYTLDEINSEFAMMTTAGSSASLKATCKWRLEYDGMLLCDVIIEPKTGSVNIQKLDLVVPFNQSAAKLFHNYPLQWYSTSPINSGAIPDTGMTMGQFIHALWIGDEKRGLQWFAESDAGLNPSTFVTIDSSKTLKLNLIGSRTISVTAPFKFTFGLQASPVKPAMPADEPRWAFWGGVMNCYNHNAGGGLVSPDQSWLKDMASRGTDCLNPWASEPVTTNPRTVYLGDPYITNPDMSALVNAGHGYGMSVMTGSSAWLEDAAPGANTVAWQVTPMYAWPDPAGHLQCQRSDWHDWFLDRCRLSVSQLGVDGFYLDGNGTPVLCNNASHGCGYQSGTSIKSTLPILDTRKMMKQLYLICRSTGKSSVIVHHTSGIVMLPCLSFAHGYLDGEHIFGYPENNPTLNTSYIPDFTLESYRAEMTGLQFGVPCFYFKNSKAEYQAEDLWRAATYAVIHGRMPLGVFSGYTFSEDAWRVYTIFGGARSDLIGYWEPSKPVTSNQDLKITTYKRTGIGALCVVGNLRNARPLSSLTGTLTVDRAALGLGTAVIQVKNAITGRDLIKTGSETFTFTVPDGQYVWLQVYTPINLIYNKKVKLSSDGVSVLTKGIVTAVFSDCCYIELENRLWGIGVDTPASLIPGDMIYVSGTMRTKDSGERYVASAVISPVGTGSIAPVNLTNKNLGGSSFNLSATSGQRGVEDGAGLNNIGMLIKTTGRVTTVGDNYFYIDDGSNAQDPVFGGVRVACEDNTSTPATGQYVVVTGISSIMQINSKYYRSLRAVDIRQIQ